MFTEYEHDLVSRGLAYEHHGRLIPILKGGDGRDEPLFSLPPEDFASLDDAELAALGAALRERAQEVFEGRREPDVVGDRTQSEVAEAMTEAVLAIEALDAELAGRSEQDDNYDDTIEQLASRAGVRAEGDAEDEAAEEASEPVEEEALAAAAVEEPAPAAPARTPRTTRPLPAARRHRPLAGDAGASTGLRVTSHAAGLGAPYDAMTVLNRGMLGNFLTDVVRRSRVNPGQKAVLAHASYTFPRERMLEDGPDSHLINSQRIRDAINPETTSLEALLASGGLCAPLPTVYDLPGVETAARPVRAALPSFMAARGGVQVGATPKLGDYADAVGVVTQAENAAGGTLAVKGCMRIICPDFNPVTVDSIYQCIEADNLAARAYPELMSRIADLVNAEQARLADSKLLDTIKAGSVKVTDGSVTAGAVWSLIGTLYTAAAGIRSRNRMPDGSTLQALIPLWVIDLLALDITRACSQDNRNATRAAVEALLRQAGIIPNFYLDGPSSGIGQVWQTQSPGTLIQFPDEAQLAVFPAGSWLHLDSGELQLGVVRDSSLNSTNDFQIFAETWENVAFTGVESLWVSAEVCASGAFAGCVDTSGICGT